MSWRCCSSGPSCVEGLEFDEASARGVGGVAGPHGNFGDAADRFVT